MSRSRVRERERLRPPVETTDPAALATSPGELHPGVAMLQVLAQGATARPSQRQRARVRSAATCCAVRRTCAVRHQYLVLDPGDGHGHDAAAPPPPTATCTTSKAAPATATATASSPTRYLDGQDAAHVATASSATCASPTSNPHERDG